MENQDLLLKEVTKRAQTWLQDGYDEETRKEVKRMLDSDDKTELIESFYRDLEFGTGGLRGIMGAGTNRMNIYTVGAATQGLANYLKEAFSELPEIKVVVGHDVRNNSRKFAEIVANIFSANGIKVYLFDNFRPTPELSFAIRELGCQSGVNSQPLIIQRSTTDTKHTGATVHRSSRLMMSTSSTMLTVSKMSKTSNSKEIHQKSRLSAMLWTMLSSRQSKLFHLIRK